VKIHDIKAITVHKKNLIKPYAQPRAMFKACFEGKAKVYSERESMCFITATAVVFCLKPFSIYKTFYYPFLAFISLNYG
jgi:hypothetical protein